MATLFGKPKRKRRRQEEEQLLPLEEQDIKERSVASRVSEEDKKDKNDAKKKNYDNNADDDDDNDGNDDSDDGPPPLPPWASLEDLGLAEPLVTTCRQMGFKKPTAVQRTVIPFLLQKPSSQQQQQHHHILALAQTGSGKTAAFVLPILHRLAADPYGIYAVILTPTRELAKQIHQQVLALGSAYHVQSALVVGGLNAVQQSCTLDHQRPHFVVATPGRLASLLQGPKPPVLRHVRYMVLDEADRLLAAGSGFERHVAELLLHCTTTTTTATTTTGDGSGDASVLRKRRSQCQTLLFSATMTKSLESIEEMAGAGLGRLPLKKFVIHENEADDAAVKKQKKKRKRDIASNEDKDEKAAEDDEEKTDGDKDDDDDDDSESSSGDDDDDDEVRRNVPKIPAGLKQEYVFMPARVRDAYLLTTVRHLLMNGGRPERNAPHKGSGWTAATRDNRPKHNNDNDDDDDENERFKARSAIVFVSTCERAALVSGILTQVGVQNVALHSLLSQNRRLASLGTFKSQQVRVLVATDVAARGLDIPTVDLVVNSELPRNPLSYVHRVGRTARAGRRGRAISLVSEAEIGLVHATESVSGRPLEKCPDVTDEKAIRLLGPVTKASRLVKMKLSEIGFDELVQKFKERKQRDKKERERIQRALHKMAGGDKKKTKKEA